MPDRVYNGFGSITTITTPSTPQQATQSPVFQSNDAIDYSKYTYKPEESSAKRLEPILFAFEKDGIYSNKAFEGLDMQQKEDKLSAALFLSAINNVPITYAIDNYNDLIKKSFSVEVPEQTFATMVKNVWKSTAFGIQESPKMLMWALTGNSSYRSEYEAKAAAIQPVDIDKLGLIKQGVLHAVGFLASSVEIFKMIAPGVLLAMATGGVSAYGQAALTSTAMRALSQAAARAMATGLAVASVVEPAAVGVIEAGAFVAETAPKLDKMGLNPEQYRTGLALTSAFVGAINGAIETMQFKHLPGVSQLDSISKRSISDYITSHLIYGKENEIIAKLIIKHAGAKTAQDMVANIGQETLQELVPDVSALLYQAYQNVNGAPKVSKDDIMGVAKDVVKTAIDTAMAVIVMGPVNFAGSVLSDKIVVSKDKAIIDFAKKMAEELTISTKSESGAAAESNGKQNVGKNATSQSEASGSLIKNPTIPTEETAKSFSLVSTKTTAEYGDSVDAIAAFSNGEDKTAKVDYTLKAGTNDEGGSSEIIINSITGAEDVKEQAQLIRALAERHADKYAKIMVASDDQTTLEAASMAFSEEQTAPQEQPTQNTPETLETPETPKLSEVKSFKEFMETQEAKHAFKNPYTGKKGADVASIDNLADAIISAAKIENKDDAKAIASLLSSYASTSGISTDELLGKFSKEGAARPGLNPDSAFVAFQVVQNYGVIPSAETSIVDKATKKPYIGNIAQLTEPIKRAADIVLYFNRENDPAGARRDIIHETTHALNIIGMSDEQQSIAEKIVGKPRDQWENNELEVLARTVEGYSDELFHYGAKKYYDEESKSFLKGILDTVVNFVYNIKLSIGGATLSDADKFVQAMFGISDADMSKIVKARDAKKTKMAGAPETVKLFNIEYLAEGAPEDLRDKKVWLTHWSNKEDLIEARPEYYGSGAAGKEKERFGTSYIPVIYYGINNYQREPALGVNRYSAVVDGNNLYDLYKDALNLYPSSDELQRNGFAPYDHKEAWNLYIKKVKEAGFEGGYSRDYDTVILWEPKPVTKLEPSDSTYNPNALFNVEVDSKGQPQLKDDILMNWDYNDTGKKLSVEDAKKYFTDEEAALSKRFKMEQLADILQHAASPEDLVIMAYSAKITKPWYEDASKGFGILFRDDVLKFIGVVASFSPQTPVVDNINAAVRFWAEWVKNGRPNDEKSIKYILHNISIRSPGISAFNNLTRVLTKTDEEILNLVLSGPKVDSFNKNLYDLVINEYLTGNIKIPPELQAEFDKQVTNDGWEAKAVGLKSERFRGQKWAGTKWSEALGKAVGYLAGNVIARNAAEIITGKTGELWKPKNIQAGSWSFAKLVYEAASHYFKHVDRNATVYDLFKNKIITPKQFSETTNFIRALAQPENLEMLESVGYNQGVEDFKKFFKETEERDAKFQHTDSFFTKPEGIDMTQDEWEKIMTRLAMRFDRQIKKGDSVLYSIQDTIPLEDRNQTTFGAKPGEFIKTPEELRPWHFSKDGLNLDILRDKLKASLQSPGNKSLITRIAGDGYDIIPHYGSWKGKRETSYTIYSPSLDFKKGTRLATLIGAMTGQESVVVWQKTEDGKGFDIVYGVNDTELTKEQIDKIGEELNKNQIDYSTTLDGKGFKILAFPVYDDDEKVILTSEQVIEISQKILKENGIADIGVEKGNSELIEAKDYLEKFYDSGGTDEDFLDGLANIFTPYLESVIEQGMGVNIDNYAKLMQFTPEQTELLYAAAKDAEKDLVDRGKVAFGNANIHADLVNMAMKYDTVEDFMKAAVIRDDEIDIASRIFFEGQQRKQILDKNTTVEAILKNIWQRITTDPEYKASLDPTIVLAARMLNKNGRLGEKMKASVEKLVEEDPYALLPSKVGAQDIPDEEYSAVARAATAKSFTDTGLAQSVLTGAVTERQISKEEEKLKKDIAGMRERLVALNKSTSEDYLGLNDKAKLGFELWGKIERARTIFDKADMAAQKALDTGEIDYSIISKRNAAKNTLDNLMRSFEKLDPEIQAIVQQPTEEAVSQLNESAWDRIQKERLLSYGKNKAEQLLIQQEYEKKISNIRALQKLKEMRAKLGRQLKKVPGSVIFEYKAPIETIIKRFNNQNVSDTEWNDFIDFVENKLPITMFDNQLLHTIKNIEPKDWTFQDLEEIYQRVRVIKAIGSDILAQKKAFEAQLRENEVRKVLDTVLGEGVEPEKPVGAPKSLGAFKKIDIDMLRPQNLASILDGWGKGVFTKWLVDEVNKSWNVTLSKQDERMNPILDKMNAYKITPIPVHKPGWTYINDALNIEYTDSSGKKTIFKYDNGEAPTIQDAMFWYIGMQNDKTRDALLNGNNIPEDVIQKGISKLTKEQKNIAEMISEDFDKNFERLRNAFIEQFNIELPKESHYIPMYRLDKFFETRQDEIATELIGRNGLRDAFVARNPTYSRLDINPANQTRIRTDMFGVWMRATEIEEAFINQDVLVKRLHSIFEDNRVKLALSQKYGKELNAWMQKYINDIARPDIYSALTATERQWASVRAGMAASHLGFNILSMQKQIFTSVLPFLAEAGPARLISAAGQWLTASRNIKNDTGAVVPELRNSLIDFVESKSETFKHRQISREFEELQHLSTKGAKAVATEIGKLAMHPLEVIDHVSLAIGWKAVYDKLKAKGMSEKESIEAADKAMIRGQPSGRVQDMPQAYRSGQLTSTILMYTNSLNALWNLIRYDIPAAYKNNQVAHWIGDITALTLSGVGIAMATGALYGGDDEERMQRILRGIAGQYADTVPYIGTLIGSVLRQENIQEGVNPLSAITPFAKGVQSIMKGDWDKAAWDALEGLGYIYKLPVIGPKRIIKAIREDRPEGILGWKE